MGSSRTTYSGNNKLLTLNSGLLFLIKCTDILSNFIVLTTNTFTLPYRSVLVFSVFPLSIHQEVGNTRLVVIFWRQGVTSVKRCANRSHFKTISLSFQKHVKKFKRNLFISPYFYFIHPVFRCCDQLD